MAMSGFFEDYDDATADVAQANHKFFVERLRTWFQTVDSNELISPAVQHLESLVDFEKWYAEQRATMGGMVGSAILEWPVDRASSLGLHLSLLRGIATNKVDWTEFASNFLASTNHFDTMVSDIASQIFRVAARDLRKRLSRPLDYENTAEQIPAADRIVRRDDNSSAFSEAINATQEVVTALEGINDYSNFEEKQRLIAEIAAGKNLMSAPEVAVRAIWATVWSALRYLLKKTVDVALSKLIGLAIAGLSALFGFIL